MTLPKSPNFGSWAIVRKILLAAKKVSYILGKKERNEKTRGKREERETREKKDLHFMFLCNMPLSCTAFSERRRDVIIYVG
jgi:hypothetical protein